MLYIKFEISMECIVAVGKNLGIGTKDDIPWKVKEDLKFFREKTTCTCTNLKLEPMFSSTR